MHALFWWLLPLAATVVAMVLVTWLSRPRRPAERYEQVEKFHKFCDAMEGNTVSRRSARSKTTKPITRMVE